MARDAGTIGRTMQRTARGGGTRAACRLLLLGLATAIAAPATPGPARADGRGASWGHRRLEARIGAEAVPASTPHCIEVDLGASPYARAHVLVVDHPATALLQDVRLGDDVGVASPQGGTPTIVFQGEVVSIEPRYTNGGEAALVIHAYDRLHRLLRGRKTRSFEDVTDAEIVETIAQENGLVPRPADDLVERHEHVVQNDETDLEFLRARAARIGYDVWVDDRDLHFAAPRAVEPIAAAPRRPDGAVRLLELHPQLSTRDTVQEVVVRGWDPRTGEAHTGRAAAPTILLTAEANDPALLLGSTLEVVTDLPLTSTEEAAAFAATSLALLEAQRMSAEALVQGAPALRPGSAVDVGGLGPRFEGRYLVVRATHEYARAPDGGAGYRTKLRLRREDGAMFFVPEIDDEVLVEFEHGDLDRPVIVGSLWNDDRSPPDCDR